jgi:hypothetical protein
MTSDGEDASRWDKDSEQIAPGRRCPQTPMNKLQGVFARSNREVSCAARLHFANFHVIDQYAVRNKGVSPLAIADYTKCGW